MAQASSYDERYAGQGYYWGAKPSVICHQVLQLLPPDRAVSLLDIGCGEGRNAVFFAHSGYGVTAFDASAEGAATTDDGTPRQNGAGPNLGLSGRHE